MNQNKLSCPEYPECGCESVCSKMNGADTLKAETTLKNTTFDCSNYPDCGCASSCKADSFGDQVIESLKKGMVKRLNEPDVFETVKPETDQYGNIWYKDPEADVIAMGPVTVKDKQILEESDWTPHVEYDPKSIQVDSCTMKDIMDVYKQMQKEDQEAQQAAEKIKLEEKKRDSVKSLLVIHCNIASFKATFQESGIESYMEGIANKFKKVLPSSVEVLTLPICNGEDRIELMHLS